MERAHSKSSLFLIEMLIIILFLAIASALCVQVFVASHGRSLGARELSMAESLAGGAADLIRGSDDGSVPDFSVYYPEGTLTEDGARIYYDADWKPCGRAHSAYCMEIGLTEEEDERVGDIRVLGAAQEEIYSLQVKVHIRDTAD